MQKKFERFVSQTQKAANVQLYKHLCIIIDTTK